MSYFDNYRCTNVVCPNCGAKGDGNITVSGISIHADANQFDTVEYACYKCHQFFTEPMDYNIEEVIIKKRIFHLRNKGD